MGCLTYCFINRTDFAVTTKCCLICKIMVAIFDAMGHRLRLGKEQKADQEEKWEITCTYIKISENKYDSDTGILSPRIPLSVAWRNLWLDWTLPMPGSKSHEATWRSDPGSANGLMMPGRESGKTKTPEAASTLEKKNLVPNQTRQQQIPQIQSQKFYISQGVYER